MKKKQDKRAPRPRKLDDKQLAQARGGGAGDVDNQPSFCDDWEAPVV